MKLLVSALALALVAGAATTARSQQLPQAVSTARDGITFEVNLGLGETFFSGDHQKTESYGSVGGLDLAIGGFVTPDIALLLRVAGTAFPVDNGSQSQQTTVANGIIGPAVQVWSDRVFFGGSIGLAYVAAGNGGTTASTRGFGVDGRIGVALSQSEHTAWDLSAELNLGMFDEGQATGIALLLGFQYY